MDAQKHRVRRSRSRQRLQWPRSPVRYQFDVLVQQAGHAGSADAGSPSTWIDRAGSGGGDHRLECETTIENASRIIGHGQEWSASDHRLRQVRLPILEALLLHW